MSDKAKNERIYNDFKKKNERDIMLNKGFQMPVGDTTITLKALTWVESEEFENTVAKVFSKVDNLYKLKTEEINLKSIIDIILGLIREDLILIANKATLGKINMVFIKQHNAYKKDIVDIVVKAFEINYGYLKNLIALSKGLR